jgi:hypothetical protein
MKSMEPQTVTVELEASAAEILRVAEEGRSAGSKARDSLASTDRRKQTAKS